MTSQNYRRYAERLLKARTVGGDRPNGALEEAAVWARLAQAAAITEAAELKTEGE
ncbi:hypothetical protein [Streptomyces sp. NPDC056543]|uniref:hypothetical protein n=1 Tax=unclassified Streptomyces TaxID=2593676 RepID=UPI00369C3786